MSYILDNIGTFLNILSITILVFGVIFLSKFKSWNWLIFYLVVLSCFEIASILKSAISNNNLLLIYSFLLHFLFLTHFYFSKIYKGKYPLKEVLYAASFLLMFAGFYSEIKEYTRFIFSLTITIYSLIYIYWQLKGTLKRQYVNNLLNYAILFFFCVDAFLAIATDYLVSNHLEIVSWFWFFRAIVLQVFYVSLIYYGFKTKNDKELNVSRL